jgi:hypothetical protein
VPNQRALIQIHRVRVLVEWVVALEDLLDQIDGDRRIVHV